MNKDFNTKSLVLLMAGSGTRSKLDINKVLYKINNIPLFMYSLNTFYEIQFDEYIIVTSANDKEEVTYLIESSPYNNIKIVVGGKTRSESVRCALKYVSTDFVYIHDAARPFVSATDICNLINTQDKKLCGSLYHNITDTARLKTVDNLRTINRDNLILMSTPQFFHKSLFNVIINNTADITDEISLFENKIDISFIKETTNNLKLTTKDDLDYIEYKLCNHKKNYIGHSLDYHPYKKDGKLVLGGIIFNDYPSLDGHSDADVVYHVVAESIMGALGIGDLGTLFPDTSKKYLNISSSYFIEEVMKKVKEQNAEIINIDVMIYLLEPNLKDYKTKMANNIKQLTNAYVNVKAATLNKKGLIALKEGIGAEAVVLIQK